MNDFSRTSPAIFKNPSSLTFLALSFLACAYIQDWEKVFSYVERINAKNCKPIAQTISFGFYDMSGAYLGTGFFPLDILFIIFAIILLGLFAPPVLVTALVMNDLKVKYAGWCPETFDVIEIFTFVLFNSFHWMFLGYFVEIARNSYKRSATLRENPLGIYSEFD